MKRAKTENFQALKDTREKLEADISGIQMVATKCETLVDQMQTTPVILRQIEEIYLPKIDSTNGKLEKLASSVDLRLTQLYEEQLWD